MSLPDITLSQLLLRAAAAFIVLAVYGLVAVWAARRSGDVGPVHDARLTPNPFVHLDVFGVVIAIFFRVTWLRDLKVDARAFRQPVAGATFTVGLATAALFCLALVALFARPLVLRALGPSTSFTAASLLDTTFEVATATAIFNLLPLPPLLGGLWWSVFGDKAAELALSSRVRFVGTLVVAALLLSGLASPVVVWAWRWLRQSAGF